MKKNMKKKMNRNPLESYSLETIGKTKKNMIWFAIVSICMMFAGFTSAYIVSMGDNFWIKIDLPTPFYISTTLIVLSSISLIFANRAIKAKKVSRTRILVIIGLILGFGFALFQYRGYKKLVDSGAHFVNHIIVNKGRYGDYYEIKKNGKYLTVENNEYCYEGKPIEGAALKDFKAFAEQFMVKEVKALPKKDLNYGKYTLLYKGEPLSLKNGELTRPNGETLHQLDFQRLYNLARNIRDGRADFFVKGELGKDFKLYYNGNELDYNQRTLLYKGKPLSINLQNKLLRGNTDKSTAYFYIITVLHLLHVVGALIMLIYLTIRTYTVKKEERLAISVKTGSMFWHFLGILWIYLLLFLVFIH